ncbi:MAG: type II secretion system protein [Patescibacteria group bacterium]|nr:type II secretion system protein [Patescibacteria group bacterium]
MSNKHNYAFTPALERHGCKSIMAQGFTLIEAVVALAIFLIAFLAVLQFLPLGSKLATIARHDTQVAFLAQGKMEEYIAKPYNALETGVVEARASAVEDTTSQLHYFEIQTEIHHVDGDLNEVSEDEGMKKIEVTVYWREGIQDKQKSWVTLVSRY